MEGDVNMKRIKELRKLLGEKYSFSRPLSDRDVFRLQKQPPKNFADTTVASLAAGCVKIEAVLFHDGKRLLLGYDIFVKDDPNSTEWIRYDTPNDRVRLKESEMLSVLDRIVTANGLSYTECCFERLDGKIVMPREKPKE